MGTSSELELIGDYFMIPWGGSLHQNFNPSNAARRWSFIFKWGPQASLGPHLNIKSHGFAKGLKFWCGEGGIRTPGTRYPVRQFSPASAGLVSATHPPLRNIPAAYLKVCQKYKI